MRARLFDARQLPLKQCSGDDVFQLFPTLLVAVFCVCVCVLCCVRVFFHIDPDALAIGLTIFASFHSRSSRAGSHVCFLHLTPDRHTSGCLLPKKA